MGLTVRPNADLIPEYLFYFLLGFDLSSISNSAGIALINNGDISAVEIPLPPVAIQLVIVAEIEAEQALVAANRELITRFEQKIQATLARIWGEEAPAVPEA
jgi:type I restriction enzyme M protein